MRYGLSKDLLPPCPGVDTHHGHSNRPGGIAYGHLKIGIIGLHVCVKEDQHMS